MNSIRARLLLWLLATLAAAALVMGGLTYRSVLGETETLFDYQLRQMALSLRDQGAIAPGQASALADEQLDFVVQIWTADGRGLYASRPHSSLPERASLGFADITAQGQTWRTFGVATRDRVIQVAQPRQIRRQLAADAALHSVAPLLFAAPALALVVWWLVAVTLAPLQRLTQGLRERDEQSVQPLATSGLPVEVAPLVAALNGLLQRLGASLDANLPFPFPTLEAELPDGSWKKVDVDVGAPCGKTKIILVDLENKLPVGARQLRLMTAFEIHWDSATLCEKVSAAQNQQFQFASAHTDLRWRGFSEFQNLPASLPLTPDYAKVHAEPPWRRTPSGWCTRYGEVNELVSKSDDALALLNGGDELALSFTADQLPPKPAGFVRDFFLHVVGWDKDADFHVGQGWRVEPLPFRGMDEQAYDSLTRSAVTNNAWIGKYNTRWVGPVILGASRPWLRPPLPREAND